MNQTHMTGYLKFKLFIILFLYVFAFYLKGISVSIILGIVLWLYSIINPFFQKQCIQVAKCQLIKNVFFVWITLSLVAIIYPVFCLTLDFSFAKLVITQGIHLFCAIPVFAWLTIKKITQSILEKTFIWLFIIQTFIQIIVYLSPSLGTAILEYNHYDPDIVVGLGSAVRGKALSAATTYHLTMAYGIAFILYLKQYYNKKINIITILIGLSLFIGIFFAGRTGFVGCGIGLIGCFWDKKIELRVRWGNIFKAIFYIIIIILSLWGIFLLLFPDIIEKINVQILPYAFEFLYSLDNSGQMETASTNRLKEMWDADITFFDLIVGSGRYTNPDGSFYMHVDPGILRHALFMGIIGYILLVYYQFTLFPINKFKDRKTKYYSILILLFLIIMEFKCINLGVNKFAFSISLLLSYCYIYLSPQSIQVITLDDENYNACLWDSSRSNKDGSAC